MLVIIGLIVGSVLVGQSLIQAAAVRAQISQIEKYQTAVNTFRGKYGYLPGDIKDPDASSFGFQARGTNPGQGDGNGVIEGSNGTAGGNVGIEQLGGETLMFWVDLTTAGLIPDGLNTATATGQFHVSSSAFSAYFPLARIGQGNYIYVYSGGRWNGVTWTKTSTNYYGLSALTLIDSGGHWPTSNPALTVSQAYAIDKKIDDGMPTSGAILAAYTNIGANGYGSDYGGPVYVNPSGYSVSPGTGAIQGTANTCYDNGNTAGAIQQYSVEQNGGSGMNCALSFQFQ